MDTDQLPTAPEREWLRPQRRPDQRVIGGVAAGLSVWLGIPVVAMRLLFVVTALLHGIGVLAYVALWLVLPEEDGEPVGPLRRLAAAVLGTVALILLVSRFDLPRSGVLLPLLLGGVGLALWRPDRHRPRPAPRAIVSAPPATEREPATGEPRRRRTAITRRDPRPPSILGRLTIAGALAALAVALIADRAGAFELTLRDGVALLLVSLGVGLIVGARYGQAHRLVLVGLPLLLLLPVATTFNWLDVDPFGHLGSRRFEVVDSRNIEDSYTNGLGSLTVDLSAIAPDAAPVRTRVSTAVGAVNVVVPVGRTVIVHARAGWGEVTVEDPFGESSPRLVMPFNRKGRHLDVTATMNGDSSLGPITVEATIGLGTIRVSRSNHVLPKFVQPAPVSPRPAPSVSTTESTTTVPTATTIGTTTR